MLALALASSHAAPGEVWPVNPGQQIPAQQGSARAPSRRVYSLELTRASLESGPREVTVMSAKLAAGLLLSCMAIMACTRAAIADLGDRSGTAPESESAPAQVDESPVAPTPARVQAGSGSGAYGAAIGIRPDYSACMSHQPPSVSTAGHRQECADEEFAFQDERLNVAYRELMTSLETRGANRSAEAAALRGKQRAWLAQLETECARQAEAAGSTMGPAALSTCFMEQTASRARELEQQRSGTN